MSAPMDPAQKIAVLCVDDEESIIAGLKLQLERRYALATALGGRQGLELLGRQPNMAVIVSDMRMPEMDGATFLARTRELAPDAVRLLLTGQTDIESAIMAVNEGQIFRFLTKPCPPKTLLSSIEAAVHQHRLITAERELLEQTLHGCIKTLTDILGLTNPAAFGRATRIKHLVGELCTSLHVRDTWQVEVAAMFSQLAHVTLSTDTAEKLYFGRALSPDEQRQVEHLPQVTGQLLANIPRLDEVKAMLGLAVRAAKPTTPDSKAEQDGAQLGAQVLRAAIDYDLLEAQAGSPVRALEIMRSRGDNYLASVLAALSVLRGGGGRGENVRELPPAELNVGMVLAEDVFLPSGVLLAARGHEITPRFMERIRNLPGGPLKKPIRVHEGSAARRA